MKCVVGNVQLVPAVNIDYKLTVGNTHTKAVNCFPQSHIVNIHLVKDVIKQSEEYVEITLYAPKQGDEQRIPVGYLLIQLNKGRIANAYYFPKDNFDYHGLKDMHSDVTPVSEALLPYFKLKPSFHPLLQAAIAIERKSSEVKDPQFDGMTRISCRAVETELHDLVSAVLYEKDRVTPSILLNCNEQQLEEIRDQPLVQAHKVLGEFLIKHVLKSALASTAIPITARLIFMNAIIDFVSKFADISPSIDDFENQVCKECRKSTQELERNHVTMSQQELFYFADTLRNICLKWDAHRYLQLSHFASREAVICKFVAVLEEIAQKHPITELKGEFAQSFLFMAIEAQSTINYWIEVNTNTIFDGLHDLDHENIDAYVLKLSVEGLLENVDLPVEHQILQDLRKDCLDLCKSLPNGEKSIAEYQSKIRGHYSTEKSDEIFISWKLRNLGIRSDQVDLKDYESVLLSIFKATCPSDSSYDDVESLDHLKSLIASDVRSLDHLKSLIDLEVRGLFNMLSDDIDES